MMAEGSFRYRVVYELVLDSGLRLEEACRFINAFGGASVEKFVGFFVAPSVISEGQNLLTPLS
jgi:intergrase/recombinase